MFRFLTRLRQSRAAGATQPPYEIVCLCATRLTGARTRVAQVARCPQCGRENFVLPRSPLPPVASLEDSIAPAAVSSPPRPRGFLFALLGMVVLLLAAGGGYLLFRLSGSAPSQPEVTQAALDRHQARGQTALADGNFQLAAGELRTALNLAEQNSALLSPADFRRLTQLHRQADLLADLLHEPLSALLHRAVNVPDEEWQVVFKRNYHAKAVVFDADVRRRADGQYEMSHVIPDGRSEARLQLEDVELLNALPLDRARRLFFGVRLADIRREPSGRWLVLLLPGSGVLLTDQTAVEACLFMPADDALLEVLQRQAEWLRERP